MIQREAGFVAATVKLFFLFVFFSGGELSAQDKTFLWKVESERNSVYILGSIHLLNKDSYPLHRKLQEAFDKSNKLVLEIDLNGVSTEKIRKLALVKGMISDGAALPQKISKETYEIVVKRAMDLGLEERMIRPFKPWFVAMTMAAMKLEKLGFSASLGVDRYLAQQARQGDKPTAGLETAEFQIGFFDQFSDRLQELLLRQTVDDMDHLEKSVDQIVRAWKNGDTGAMENLLLAAMRAYPEIHQKIIDDRNHRWLPQIENILSSGENALIVVGAAHLVGKAGVIELLRGRGYKVEQE
jgi:hypothetical protein